MDMYEDHIEEYWQAHLATLGPDTAMQEKKYIAEAFGDNPELANHLGSLVKSGVKTATCSALWEWEAEGIQIPEVGTITIVLDGSQKPLCIIETIEVKILPYEEVDAKFAYEEGEGDRSLEY
jgi:uncharacterized protein YhfF